MDSTAIKNLIQTLREGKHRVVTAESLTAGMIGSAFAGISGASDVLNGGLIVYQDEVKTALLGVPADMLREFTAVSRPVAEAMARGALLKTGPDILGTKASDIAIAVTGYASNPGSLAPATDTGLVYIGIAHQFNGAAVPSMAVYDHRFTGDRNEVRQATVDQALQYVAELLTPTRR